MANDFELHVSQQGQDFVFHLKGAEVGDFATVSYQGRQYRVEEKASFFHLFPAALTSETPLAIESIISQPGGNISTKVDTVSRAVLGPPAAQQIDALVQDTVKKEGFSGSVLVIHNGSTILEKGYGLATETQENTPQTSFRLASLTKPLTVATVLRLSEKTVDGRPVLELSRPICEYLPFLQEKIKKLIEQGDKKQAEWLQAITIKDLMNHTSGLASDNAIFTPLGDQGSYTPHSLDEMIEKFKDLPIEFKPGTNRKYSNYGYLLLVKIIEEQTKKPFSQVMKEEVFQPLQMHNSSCPMSEKEDCPQAQSFAVQQFITQYPEMKPFVTAPAVSQDPLKKVLIKPHHISVRIGSGNAISTVRDVATFAQALQNEQFLGKESRQLISGSNGGWDFCEKSAEGLFVPPDQVKGIRGWVSKAGDMAGCHCVLWSFPDSKSQVVILSNTETCNGFDGSVGPLSIDIASVILTRKQQ